MRGRTKRHEQPVRTGASSARSLRHAGIDDWGAIEALQQLCYEPERRLARAELELCLQHGLVLIAEVEGTPVGLCCAAPVEHFAALDGPRQDDTFGRGETLYAHDLTVAPEARGQGIGRALKLAQLEWAARAGYRFVSGRNRVGHTREAGDLNRSLGAHPLAIHHGQYGGRGSAVYYRIPLPSPSAALDFAGGSDEPGESSSHTDADASAATLALAAVVE